jgi:hypothetical protein
MELMPMDVNAQRVPNASSNLAMLSVNVHLVVIQQSGALMLIVVNAHLIVNVLLKIVFLKNVNLHATQPMELDQTHIQTVVSAQLAQNVFLLIAMALLDSANPNAMP